MFYIILYMYYIITQYVYTGYYDTVCECKHTTDRGMDKKNSWKDNHWQTDWQIDKKIGYLGVTDSTEVWRFLEFSSCSFSFWEYSLGWYCVVALRGYFQSVCVPSSTNSGIDYNNKQIKLTYSYHSVERHYFINKLTTSYFLEFCI